MALHEVAEWTDLFVDVISDNKRKVYGGSLMDFMIDDGGFDNTATISPILESIIEFIDNLPDGRFVTIHRLAENVGVNSETIAKYTARPPLLYRRIKISHNGTIKGLFGNLKTIEAYKGMQCKTEK